MFECLGRLVYRRRIAVLVLAAVFVVFAITWGTKVFSSLSDGGFDDPRSESSKALATIDQQRLDAMLDLNIIALTNLTRAFLRAMIERKRGAILNVSSCAGFIPLPRMAVYSAAKAYVTSFSEAVHAEVRQHGVTVTALCPGPVHTEFNDTARRPRSAGRNAPEFTHVSPEAVVHAALNAIEHDRPLVIPGVVMKLGMLLVRLTPMPLLRLAARFGELDEA